MLNNYLQFFLIFKLTDVIEISFFSILFYSFSVWLSKDKQKNLLPTFYLMNVSLIFTNITCMQTIYNFLINFWPAIITLFILVHQNILQKNFITLKNLSPIKNNNIDWFENLMRSCLMALNNKKELIVVVEGKDSFENFIDSSFTIKTSINQELLTALINSPSFDNKKMIWISYNGILQAINSNWNIQNDIIWPDDNQHSMEGFKQDAILFTSKMDALVFKTNLNKRTFDIVVCGKLIEDVAPNNAINIVDQFIKKIQISKKENNEIKINSAKHNNKQPVA